MITARFNGNSVYAAAASAPIESDALEPVAHGLGSPPHYVYVEYLYADLLGRAMDGDPASSYWVQQLDGGMTCAEATAAFASSAEHQGYVVERTFEDLLRRRADATGSSYWQSVLPTLGEEALDSLLLGSDEYDAAVAGSTPVGFVESAYLDVLGRAADTGGAAYFEAQLAAGASRENVAGQLLQSDEGRARRIGDLYHLLLGRDADPAGSSYWAGQLDAHHADSVRVALESSPENTGTC
jgi:hypothetical protein